MASTGVAIANVEGPRDGSVGEFLRFFDDLHLALYRADAFNGDFRKVADSNDDGPLLLGGTHQVVMEFLTTWGQDARALTPQQILKTIEDRFGGPVPKAD